MGVKVVSVKVDRLERPGIWRNVQTARLHALLVFLGIPRKDVYLPKNRPKPQGTYWQRNEANLPFILHDVHLAYRESIKACHPDRKGGCGKRAAALNQAWQRVKKLFAQKGVRLNAWIAALLLLASSSASAVTLTWDANAGTNVAGYKLYCGASSGCYTNAIDFGPSRTNTVSTVAGMTNYFVVTAYDSNGIESDFSAELAYVPGLPQAVTVRFDRADSVAGPWTNLQTIITTRPGYWRVTISR